MILDQLVASEQVGPLRIAPGSSRALAHGPHNRADDIEEPHQRGGSERLTRGRVFLVLDTLGLPASAALAASADDPPLTGPPARVSVFPNPATVEPSTWPVALVGAVTVLDTTAGALSGTLLLVGDVPRGPGLSATIDIVKAG